MTVIGLDDTDSREHGMCTTYLATRVAESVRDAGGSVSDLLLVRLNPAQDRNERRIQFRTTLHQRGTDFCRTHSISAVFRCRRPGARQPARSRSQVIG